MSNQASTVRWKGLAANLLAIAPELHKKHTKRAVTKACKVVRLRAAANAHASRDTGALARSLDEKVIMFRDNKGAAGFVGPDRGYSEPDRKGRRHKKTKRTVPSNYAHLVELGTSHSAAKPFLRPAMDSAKENAEGIMANEMSAGLDAVSSKLPQTP